MRSAHRRVARDRIVHGRDGSEGVGGRRWGGGRCSGGRALAKGRAPARSWQGHLLPNSVRLPALGRPAGSAALLLLFVRVDRRPEGEQGGGETGRTRLRDRAQTKR